MGIWGLELKQGDSGAVREVRVCSDVDCSRRQQPKHWASAPGPGPEHRSQDAASLADFASAAV